MYRVGAGSDVQRRIGAGKSPSGRRLQAAAGRWSRYIHHVVQQVAAVSTTNGHRNSQCDSSVQFTVLFAFLCIYFFIVGCVQLFLFSYQNVFMYRFSTLYCLCLK